MSQTCHDCWHDDTANERCGINRPGYPFCGTLCKAFHPKKLEAEVSGCGLTPEEAGKTWPAFSRLAGVVGWLFGGGA